MPPVPPQPQQTQQPQHQCVSVVVFGASGDLAKKKTFPALFGLYRHQLLPAAFQIVGYARSQLTDAEFRQRTLANCKAKPGQPSGDHRAQLDAFADRCRYIDGGYEAEERYAVLAAALRELERSSGAKHALRVFYLALPPTMFHPVSAMVKKVLFPSSDDSIKLDCRVVVEKPFGHDLASSNLLSEQLGALFHEEQIYRIDHYLGKEMVKNLLILRFANQFFNTLWNRQNIHNIQITFKEPFGTEGRGGYFDDVGIIRDVVQNHLVQVLSVVAMERPVTLDAEDVRDEKVKVLKAIRPLTMDQLLVGQYTASLDGSKPGYQDDKAVPKGSICPTYAAMVLFVDNERWAGVPWILKAGKALNEQKAEIRVQFRDIAGSLFPNLARNELVIRVQPNESVYMKFNNKKPGLGMETTISELDLSYHSRYQDAYIPDAYEALLVDLVARGDRSNFVRADELQEAWKIFTPVLHQLDRDRVQPVPYPYGSRGPAGANAFVERWGFVRHEQEYVWSPATATPTPSKI